MQDDHPSFIDALLQFASAFCTEIAVEKHFDPQYVTSGGATMGLNKFSRLAIARHISVTNIMDQLEAEIDQPEVVSQPNPGLGNYLGPPHKLCCNSTTGLNPALITLIARAYLV